VQVVPISADIVGAGGREQGLKEADGADTQLLQETPYNNIVVKPSFEGQQPPAGGHSAGSGTEHMTRTVVVEFDPQVEEVNGQSEEIDKSAFSNLQ
jgi:hypothetical protein